jgi:hypothetical protein
MFATVRFKGWFLKLVNVNATLKNKKAKQNYGNKSTTPSAILRLIA